MSVPIVYTTGTGVKLRIRPVPSLAVMAAIKQIKEPEIPIWHNDARDRDEPNPLDPGYLKAIEDHKIATGEKTTDVYLANGLSVLDPIPDDVESINSDVWAEGLKLVGIDIPDSGIYRRVAWLRYYVLSDQDLMEVTKTIALAGGVVTEEQVSNAIDSFRDNTTGDANTQVSTISEDRRWD